MIKRMESFAKTMKAFGIEGSADDSPESTKAAEECAKFFDLARSIELMLTSRVKGHFILSMVLAAPLCVFLLFLVGSISPLFPLYPRLEILWAILFISTLVAIFTEFAIAVSLAKMYVKALIVQGDLPLSIVDSMPYAVEHDALFIFRLYQRGGADALRKGWKKLTRMQLRALRNNEVVQ